MNRVRLHDPLEISKEAGSIARKEILVFNVYSSWPPIGQDMLTKKFEVPFFTETLGTNKKTDKIPGIVKCLA